MVKDSSQLVMFDPPLDDQMLLLTTRKQEILKVTGVNIDPDEIAVRLIERVHDLTAFLASQDVVAQRKALFAFCKRIVAVICFNQSETLRRAG